MRASQARNASSVAHLLLPRRLQLLQRPILVVVVVPPRLLPQRPVWVVVVPPRVVVVPPRLLPQRTILVVAAVPPRLFPQ